MKFAILMTCALLIASSWAYRTPKERQLLYKEKIKSTKNSKLQMGRLLTSKKDRKLAMFGPGDDEIVKIKAKKDMLQKKIDMDNGRRFSLDKEKKGGEENF